MDEDISKSVKIILWLILLVAALVVIVTTRNIFVSNASDVWGNCVEESLKELENYGAKIGTGDEAAKVLKSIVGGEPVLSGSSIEPCGIAYIFKIGEEKYLVCEDGSISVYAKVCKDEGLYDKTKTSLRTMRDSNTSQLG